MSLRSRREYLRTMRERYAAAHQRSAKARIIDEVVDTLQYHRKYAIQVLGSSHELAPPATRSRRQRPLRYLEALPVIQTVWEALDDPCAEGLQPVPGGPTRTGFQSVRRRQPGRE
ncbi:MAG: hypothetical protein IMW99_08000 [Firmicutes bacterium]|nr:hypothetical protein [Bacillota bacterium]